jgi:hypothetical protein
MTATKARTELERLCRAHTAWEPNTDKTLFQRRARLLQALWRAERGFRIGSMRSRPRW